jgi:hypothetical protein
MVSITKKGILKSDSKQMELINELEATLVRLGITIVTRDGGLAYEIRNPENKANHDLLYVIRDENLQESNEYYGIDHFPPRFDIADVLALEITES